MSDLSEFRSRLGLPDDADEAAILAAFDEQLKAAKPTEPATDSAPVEGTGAPAETTPAAEPAKELVTAAAQPDPRIEAMAAELKAATSQLAEIRAAAAANEKKTLLDSAQAAGKFTPADRGAWEKRYDQSAEVVKDVLAAIAPGTAVPVKQTGYVGDPDVSDDRDDDLDALFAPGTLAVADSKES